MRHAQPGRSFRTSHWPKTMGHGPTVIAGQSGRAALEPTREEAHKSENMARDRLGGLAIASTLVLLTALALIVREDMPVQLLDLARQPYDIASEAWIALSRVDRSYSLWRGY